jgi:hypothetical protein
MAAKAACESLCSLLSKSAKGINIFSPWLPKLATGQTVSLIGKRIDTPDVNYVKPTQSISWVRQEKHLCRKLSLLLA